MIKRLLPILLAFAPLAAYAAPPSNIKWRDWSPARFEEAKAQKKLVYLNLEAVWCHWCHVMAEKTYSQKEVAAILGKSYVTIKVDQDAHPELSLRYRDYGWPATIIFNEKGEELEKLSGFIEAPELLKILNDRVKNRSPSEQKGGIESEFAAKSSLEPAYRDTLIKKHYDSLDLELGGLKTSHKYLDSETAEYALIHAAKGQAKDAEFLKLTLKSNRQLFDPIWGGVYQYSTRRVWTNPHFEKIMQTQADNLRIYGSAYALWKEEADWQAAIDVYRYVNGFLTSPDGAFYTSQDADLVKGKHAEGYFQLNDADRRKQGIPAVDKNIYARENGWMINSYLTFYAATNNSTMRDGAIKAADWIAANRKLEGGGFKHGENDKEGPFLGDSLSMGQAFLSLYGATGERRWLKDAEGAASFIFKNFAEEAGGAPGFVVSKQPPGSVLKPFKDMTENVQAARFFNLLARYTAKPEFKSGAESAMRYLATPATSKGYINESGILIADYELNREPLHITIVGHKDDPLSALLFQAGLNYFSPYKRLEWWDKREGPMPNPDVEYPQMAKPAAFICTNKRCSLPIFKPEGIPDTIKLFHKDEK